MMQLVTRIQKWPQYYGTVGKLETAIHEQYARSFWLHYMHAVLGVV